MKKIFILLLVFVLSFKISSAQHFVPVDIITDARNINVSIYGGLSLDGGNGSSFAKSLTSSTQTGFIVNALYKTKAGGTQTFHQFLVDFNPIIVNWNPFTWNKLIEQPIDSFAVNKMPFQEDAVLHIGWHKNYLFKYHRGGNKQQQHLMFFGEMYFRPYNVVKTENNVGTKYRFSVFNVNLGTQYAYIKKEVPVLGNFLIGAVLQFNFMLTNETDEYLGSMKTVMGKSYLGKQYMGPGAKIVVQTNKLNIYVEGRQYYSMENSEKFTQDPIILVGAFGNLNWKRYKNKQNKPSDDDLE